MTDTLTIRRADSTDALAIRRLAVLDSSDPPGGEVLVAYVDGELWAAVSIETGAAVADPFRKSGELVELLRFRAERLRSGDGAQRGALARLLPRAA